MVNNIRKLGTYYMLYHIETGLYYVPFNYKTRSQLGEFGKLFSKFPDFLRQGKDSHIYDTNGEKRPVILSEWEVHTINIQVNNSINCKDDADRRAADKASKLGSRRL
jgi:hypothetical protein